MCACEFLRSVEDAEIEASAEWFPTPSPRMHCTVHCQFQSPDHILKPPPRVTRIPQDIRTQQFSPAGQLAPPCPRLAVRSCSASPSLSTRPTPPRPLCRSPTPRGPSPLCPACSASPAPPRPGITTPARPPCPSPFHPTLPEQWGRSIFWINPPNKTTGGTDAARLSTRTRRRRRRRRRGWGQ